MAIDVRRNISRLISQYHNAPGLRKLVTELLALQQTQINDALVQVERYVERTAARGVWLDYIGTRLGFVRPSILDSSRTFFGFAKQSSAPPNTTLSGQFDASPMFTVNAALQGRVKLGDTYYTDMLTARALTLRSTSSRRDIEAVLDVLFEGGGTVRESSSGVTIVASESRPGYLTVVQEHQSLLIPRTAGIPQTLS